MATNATQATDFDVSDLHRLDVKALTTKMSAFEDAPGVYIVQHDTEHRVAEVDGEYHCDCKGHQYGHKCYHIRRLEFATGEREIPSWVNGDAVDPQLGLHVGGPVATDGGVREGSAVWTERARDLDDSADDQDQDQDQDDECWCADRDLACYDHFEIEMEAQ